MGGTCRRVSRGSDHSLLRVAGRFVLKRREAAGTRNLVMLILLLMAAVPSWASTYYVSKSTGSDSNSGTSKGAAWAHLPGMASWTGSHTPVAGDTFILMGCDVWGSSDLPILWNWSGSSGNVITIGGEDHTWYNTTNCPSTWNRPIFDAQKTVLSGYNFMFEASASNSTSYVTLDNVEMRGLEVTSSDAGDFLDAFNQTNNWTLSNLYIHAWDSSADNCRIVQWQTGGNVFTNSVIDGSDGTGAAATASCYAFYPTPPDIKNSVIHDVPNGIVGYAGGLAGGTTVTVNGNLIYNINPSYEGESHINTMEWVGAGTYYVANNVFHDNGGEQMFFCNAGEVDYFWNNLWYNMNGAPPEADGRDSPCTAYFYNNTIVNTQSSGVCIGLTGASSGVTVNVENLHCISPGGFGSWGGGTTSLWQTPAQADADNSPNYDQYTASETYAYSPVAGTNSTVGAGTNLTASCSGSLTSLCFDTSYACTEQTVNGVVQAVCPTRTAVARPTSAAWDIGAYQDPSSSGPLQPPTNVKATAH